MIPVCFCVQECVRVRGEEFVTSLASLTENLLYQLDNLLTPAGNLSPFTFCQSVHLVRQYAGAENTPHISEPGAVVSQTQAH